MSSSNRIQSKGVIVDYMLNGYVDAYDVCVNFEGARVKPVTLPSVLLIESGVDITIGSVFEAEINSEADEEYFVSPTFVRPLIINMEVVYTWH